MFKYLMLLGLLVATPAKADGFKNREIAYQTLNAVDAIQTCHFLAKGGVKELNPILGSNPSCKKVVGFKIAAGVLHYVVARSFDEETAKIFQITTIVIQGGVVTWNFQF